MVTWRAAASGHSADRSVQGSSRSLSAAVLERQGVDAAALPDADLELVFGLVEGIISQRQWGDDGTRAAYAEAVVRGCLRLVHVPEPEIAAAVAAGEALAARFRAEVPQPD
jgi:hypothetical protein